MSCSGESGTKHAIHGRGTALPLGDLDVELPASLGGDAIVPRGAEAASPAMIRNVLTELIL
ncbi:MAG TPA: hypothetical protein VGM82_02075 [Gemmatimonadaceae bacterium]|jgi:hypothetical protein